MGIEILSIFERPFIAVFERCPANKELLMAIIPHKIHFIWVGTPLQQRYVENVASWAERNPLYEVYVWTENHMLRDVQEKFVQQFQRTMDFQSQLPIIVAEHSDGYDLHISTIAHSILFRVISIGTLTPISDPTFWVEEMQAWKNYGAASDILRLWVLYNHGGIYMDMDTYQDSKPLPLGIVAPKSLLFGTGGPAKNILLYNALIASPAQNHRLRSLAFFMDHEYWTDYPEVRMPKPVLIHTGAYKVSEKVKIDTDLLGRWRTNLSAYSAVISRREAALLAIPSDRSELKRNIEEDLQSYHSLNEVAKENIKEILMFRTLKRTGPMCLRRWIAKEEVGWQAVPEYEETVIVEGAAIDEFVENVEITMCYNFNIHSGYSPVIESHGQWMK